MWEWTVGCRGEPRGVATDGRYILVMTAGHSEERGRAGDDRGHQTKYE